MTEYSTDQTPRNKYRKRMRKTYSPKKLKRLRCLSAETRQFRMIANLKLLIKK